MAGFVADPGTQQTQGVLPTLTARLNKLANALGVTIYGISGFRTPAHSVAVGGFANDPHTKGQAEDIAVNSQLRATAASIPTATLHAYGLDRPFDESDDPSNSEVNHIQLLSTSGTKTPVTQTGSTQETLAQLWVKNGGPPSQANMAAAVAMAESGGKINAIGGPNTNGTYDYGLWQVNSVHGYDSHKLTSDPDYNAQAAVAVYKSSGWDAWSTVLNGAYRKFLGQAGPEIPTKQGVTRPGGDPTPKDSGDATASIFDDYEGTIEMPRTAPNNFVSTGAKNPFGWWYSSFLGKWSQ